MWVFLLDGKVLTIKDPNFSTTEQAFTKNHPNLYEVLCKNLIENDAFRNNTNTSKKSS